MKSEPSHGTFGQTAALSGTGVKLQLNVWQRVPEKPGPHWQEQVAALKVNPLAHDKGVHEFTTEVVAVDVVVNVVVDWVDVVVVNVVVDVVVIEVTVVVVVSVVVDAVVVLPHIHLNGQLPLINWLPSHGICSQKPISGTGVVEQS